jgi:hypothetical protein
MIGAKSGMNAIDFVQGIDDLCCQRRILRRRCSRRCGYSKRCGQPKPCDQNGRG